MHTFALFITPSYMLDWVLVENFGTPQNQKDTDEDLKQEGRGKSRRGWIKKGEEGIKNADMKILKEADIYIMRKVRFIEKEQIVKKVARKRQVKHEN